LKVIVDITVGVVVLLVVVLVMQLLGQLHVVEQVVKTVQSDVYGYLPADNGAVVEVGVHLVGTGSLAQEQVMQVTVFSVTVTVDSEVVTKQAAGSTALTSWVGPLTNSPATECSDLEVDVSPCYCVILIDLPRESNQ